jgi:hypothetical protein
MSAPKEIEVVIEAQGKRFVAATWECCKYRTVGRIHY